MCGVAALVGPPPLGSDPGGAADAIAGRGPDGTARWEGDGLLLVSSRLAHWDEGAPQQPHVTPEGAAAAFNGELFNLAELQAVLGRPGASEIEVLLAGLEAQGPEFLRHVDGQFALVARPVADGPTLLARDRFGVAPLYWAPAGGAVAVGSNLRAVLALRGEDAELDDDGLGSILEDWAPTRDLSPWRGVRQVRPGHVVTVEDGRVVGERAWTPPPSPRTPSGPASEIEIAELEEALRGSVTARLRSTGKVACLVSGGIDSTIVGALAAEEGARLGLSLCLEGDDVVGMRQREVADILGMELVQHTLTPSETVAVFEDYVRTRRMPLVRLGPIGMTALARRAVREGIRGVLSGEGADELFAGYDSYRILAARAGAFGDRRSLPWAEFGDPEFGAHRGAVWARSYWRGLIAFSDGAGARRSDILRPVADLLRGPIQQAVLDPALPVTGVGDPLEARRQVDLERLLGGYLLTVQGDHAWMEEGVELRPPYLARRVVGWALARDVRDFLRISDGKTPVRALLPRLAARRPALAGLGFAKAAFRVDVPFLLRDLDAFDRFADLASRCPDTHVDADGVRHRLDAARRSGTCSEAESQLLTLAASLGILVPA